MTVTESTEGTETEVQDPPSPEAEAVEVKPEPTGEEPESRSFSEIIEQMDDVVAEAAKDAGVDLDAPATAESKEADTDTEAEGEEADDPEGETTDPDETVEDLNYSLEGEDAEVKWSEGAEVTFKADGQQVKVGSMTELVEFAQKGVHAARRLTEIGNEKADAVARVATLETELKDKGIEWEELLVSALTNEEVAEQMREALGPLKSKEAREGARAKDELAERDKADQARTEADETKAWSETWDKYAQDVKDVLGSEAGKAEYPMLRETDIPRIQHALFQTSENYREILTKNLVDRGRTQEEAEGTATAEAARWLTEERPDALARVLKTMNADFADRVLPPESPNGESPDPDPSKADAAQHNARIDKKLEQRKGQTMQGSGSTPSGQTPVKESELEGDTTFEKRMSAIDRVFEDFKETGQT